jgi:hypothetical protein
MVRQNSKETDKRPAPGRLILAIRDYIDERNKDPKRFIWTAGPE